MATLKELADFPQTNSTAYSDLEAKITVAVAIKAVAIANSVTPTAAQTTWALATIANPAAEAKRILAYVMAKNAAATVAQIAAATDVTIQSNVDEAVDKLATL